MPNQGDDLGLKYLDGDDVIALHAGIFDCTVEQANDQLRNRAGLEGAVARPLAHALYGGADIALQAAVLAHGIAESQVFVDGNKRTALIALLTFLDINGWGVDADDVTLASWILDLGEGSGAEELAGRVRDVLHE